jgi:hypothetical protein
MKKTPDVPSNSESGFVRNSHYILLTIIASFVLAALVLGEWMNMYDAVWWWDDMLHGLSGVILGLIGLLAIYFFNARRNMNLSPAFVAVFVFCFAVTMGVLWEVYEFKIDVLFGTTMQQWNMSSNAVVMGREFQGMGLRDTMSDLIVACVGALVAAVFSYFVYRYEKPTVLNVMRRIFPKKSR